MIPILKKKERYLLFRRGFIMLTRLVLNS
ncbi:hypothetical protein AAY473_022343 [Plecturocebus cupreus]